MELMGEQRDGSVIGDVERIDQDPLFLGEAVVAEYRVGNERSREPGDRAGGGAGSGLDTAGEGADSVEARQGRGPALPPSAP
jgi:hypothetical protein